MAKAKSISGQLLRWSAFTPASDVQDPLGLNLRGSTRLATRLLFCITSITPRARYFSFLSWCIQDYRQNEHGRPSALGLREAIRLREHALAIGCVAHHGGKSCAGGGLVGSDKAVAWFGRGNQVVELAAILAGDPFTKNPALDAYFNSMVNLGLFVSDEDLPEDGEEDAVERSFDDVRLSPLGEELAESYGSSVTAVVAIAALSPPRRSATILDLGALGEHGGLCELASGDPLDRGLLRDVFFNERLLKSRAHRDRRMSLLLALELARRCEDEGRSLDEQAFAGAVYYGEIPVEGGRLRIDLPGELDDINLRWRMFYFHHYAAVALEAIFSWVVTALHDRGLVGSSLEELTGPLKSVAFRRYLSEELAVGLPHEFAASSPRHFFAAISINSPTLDDATSRILDEVVRPDSRLSESHLEDLLRGNGFLHSPDALGVSLVLLATTLGRFEQWRASNFGNWLAAAAKDPYIDVVPPVLSEGLLRRFGDWWGTPWDDLSEFILSRYVIQQHRTMAYEKTVIGDRCIIETDGKKIWATGDFGKIGMMNPRLRSALQILTDLALLQPGEGGGFIPTEDGRSILATALVEEAAGEIR